jgi:hypothetical protein
MLIEEIAKRNIYIKGVQAKARPNAQKKLPA